MTISSKFIGYLRIVGVAGKVSSALEKVSIWGRLNFDMIPIKGDSNPGKRDYDRKLEIQVLPPISALKVRFSEVPKEVLAGEVFPITVELSNTGPNNIKEIFLATNSPKELILKSESSDKIALPLSIEKGS